MLFKNLKTLREYNSAWDGNTNKNANAQHNLFKHMLARWFHKRQKKVLNGFPLFPVGCGTGCKANQAKSLRAKMEFALSDSQTSNFTLNSAHSLNRQSFASSSDVPNLGTGCHEFDTVSHCHSGKQNPQICPSNALRHWLSLASHALVFWTTPAGVIPGGMWPWMCCGCNGFARPALRLQDKQHSSRHQQNFWFIWFNSTLRVRRQEAPGLSLSNEWISASLPNWIKKKENPQFVWPGHLLHCRSSQLLCH